MPSKWSVIFFQDKDGLVPVQNYILTNHNEKDIATLIAVVQRLASVGLELINTNMCDEIESPIYELRKDRHRILFGRDGNTFVLLSGFIKKTQKTPRTEIDLAKQRFQEYLKTKKFIVVKIPN